MLFIISKNLVTEYSTIHLQILTKCEKDVYSCKNETLALSN